MKKIKRINEIIAQQIEWRYELLNWNHYRTRHKKNKEIYDSYFPGLVYKSIKNKSMIESITSKKRKDYVLSERISKITGNPLLHISEITNMLGYTKTEISKILAKVKKNQPRVSLLGMGGSGSNFIHWTYLMAEWTNKLELFYELTLIDFDKFDTTNMLRIPFASRNNVMHPYKVNVVPTKYTNIAKSYRTTLVKIERGNDAVPIISNMKNTYVYGAPDLETRKLLNELNVPYYAATHKDNRCGIKYMPDVDDELGIETYGKINLTVFFLNHIQMTIEFLKFLGEPRQLEKNEILYYHDYDEDTNYLRDVPLKTGNKKLFIPAKTIDNELLERIEEE